MDEMPLRCLLRTGSMLSQHGSGPQRFLQRKDFCRRKILMERFYTPCITGCICLPSRASLRVSSMSPVRAIMEVGFFTGSSWPKGTK